MSAEKKAIPFLCVANSARSQMAEGLARAVAPEGVEIFSAGSSPTSVHSYAQKVLLEAGIDISSQYSKSVDDIPAERIGAAITLCAEEVCPAFPGEVRRLHWPQRDPANIAGSEEEIRDVFRQVRDEIREKIETFFGADSQTG